MSPNNIALIIEDSEGLQLIYSRYLESCGFDVKQALTLREGILLCSEIPPPDLIWLDLNLSDSSEEGTLAHIATLQKLAPKAIIWIVSGCLTEELRSRAVKLGVHLVKDKLEIHRLGDLWSCVAETMANAPTKSQDCIKFTAQIIKSLSETLNLF